MELYFLFGRFLGALCLFHQAGFKPVRCRPREGGLYFIDPPWPLVRAPGGLNVDARNGSQPTQDYDKILPINASKTKTAALYARYSTDKQNERSIDDQFASCKRLYADRNGCKIVQTFSDAAKTSATMFNRDGLIKMMQAAERREFDVILAEGVDRIAGNSADMHSIYDRLEFCGVELHTVADGRVNDMHI
ncbi:MAG: recombinase family protein, partial [Xanthobacteraceae bacterium]